MKRLTIFAVAALILTACAGPKQIDSMSKDFLTLATERYSVRHFSGTQVDRETIDYIIQAGRVAPTAVNSQPQMVYVATSPEVMEKLGTVSPCIYGAPHCFIFCCNTNNVCKRGENGDYGDIDVTIVLTHMMLAAAEKGVGTCCVGYFNPEKLMSELDLPANVRPILLMPFGYAAEDAAPSPRHSEYRPIEETVKFL